jgi:hypothetical protein
MELKLNIEAIDEILTAKARDWDWLMVRMRRSRTTQYYIKKERPISYAQPIGRILKVNPKDLLI